MRWRQVRLLYVVLGALAAEYWFVERRVEPQAMSEPDAPPPFLRLRPAELREIRLVRGGRTIICRRDGAAWAIVEPAGAPVAPDLIAAFTNALAEATESAHVGGASADAHAFGLDDGAAQVEMIADGAEPIGITIGGTNPTGTAVYARRRGAPDVVLIGRNVRYYEDLIFQALSADRVPATEAGAPIGG